jgi:hypothetical protein
MAYAVQLISRRHKHLGTRMVGFPQPPSILVHEDFKSAAKSAASMTSSMHVNQIGNCYSVVPLPLYGVVYGITGTSDVPEQH